DVYGRVLIDPELGIATDYLDPERRLKSATLKKNVLRRKMELDNLGEELRVLYVAMTRAKEMLVMTGTDKYLEKSLERFSHIPVTDGRIPFTVLGTAGSYLDWLLMAFGSGRVRIRREEVSLSQIVGGEMERQVQIRRSRASLDEIDISRTYDEEVRRMLLTNLNYHYPHEADIALPVQASVSELKGAWDGEEEESGLRLYCHSIQKELPVAGPVVCHSIRKELPVAGPVVVEYQPEEAVKPAKDSAFLGGAKRGSVYHRVLELIPFDRMESRGDVEEYLERMVEERTLSEDERKLVHAGVIWRFLESDLGKRMRRAQADGRLCREKQFVMGVPAREMDMGDSDELVVVQGIIDLYFEEEGELVLVDYKTDRVTDAAVLVEHYRGQMDYYERALRQMTGKKIREKMIYSLALQMEIRC
ncbi:MAG: PD-(D/E)XK nuclease family protein, partial [Clostridiales bacterium]|nr:PD-(D/E)XK nuclease family protein [Clostridiales bacterium]